MRVVVIGGTFYNIRKNAPQDNWCFPGSDFYQAAASHGIECLSGSWSSRIDGVIGPNDNWIEAGDRVYQQIKDLSPRRLIVHSHAGNVWPYICIRHNLSIDLLITLATPVRPDVPYALARPYVKWWEHYYGDYHDYVQIAGELMVGRFHALRRQMPLANINRKFSGADHSKLHSVELWEENHLWDRVKLEHPG